MVEKEWLQISYQNLKSLLLIEASEVQDLRSKAASLTLTHWFLSMSSSLCLAPSLLISKISNKKVWFPVLLAPKYHPRLYSQSLVISRVIPCSCCPGGHRDEAPTRGTEERGTPSEEADWPPPKHEAYHNHNCHHSLYQFLRLEDAYLRPWGLLEGTWYKWFQVSHFVGAQISCVFFYIEKGSFGRLLLLSLLFIHSCPLLYPHPSWFLPQWMTCEWQGNTPGIQIER